MKRIVIGTAGHIDHGKTTLVKALTGIETDRLKEEQARGISIELGFAPFALPNGQKAAIVDMPGHERFIKHMLAGAFGIDIVLLTIAADESIMPQTKEHLDIIELLGISKGIVVITKKDLVDEEWLFLVEEEVKEYLADTILREAPIVSVSALNKEGIPELLDVIEELTQDIEEKPLIGQARLPIDRVFTISGFGTVVTGTLWSGQLNVGDTIQIMPADRLVRIRTLQVHNEKVPTAYAGNRVAVNLQGIEVADINRGYWLTSPNFLQATYRVDTKLHLIKSTKRVISNWSRIRFHLGTDEVLGRVVLLDRDELRGGEEAYAQIVMEKPVVCYKGDPFVIRYYSPVTTIGGGVIIDSNAPKQKRFKEDVLEQLAMKEEGSLEEVILQEMESNPYLIFSKDELAKRTGNTVELIEEGLNLLLAEDSIIDLRKGEYISSFALDLITTVITDNISDFHKRFPLRLGYPKEDMRSRHFNTINSKSFNLVLSFLEGQQILTSQNNMLKLASHEPLPNQQEAEIIAKIMVLFEDNLFSPPALTDVKGGLKVSEDEFMEIINYLLGQERLIRLSPDIICANSAVEKGKDLLNEYFAQEKELTLGTTRDLFNTSRKYALPWLEYYDKIRFTRRVGDVRIKL
ncbi:MAG: selenocysteine-specific translation elongation factor [Syntrophomonadaceae bacterium]|nr:selenocysteine-specific translation elongation factor [Syntrophomonadaceae bacterium]